MGQVRPQRAGGAGAPHGVARSAGLAFQHRPAGLLLRCPGPGGLSQLRVPPALKILRRFHHDQQCHVGMLHAAKLGALRAVDARLVRREHKNIFPPGDHVLLSGQVRHPEGMDDVCRCEFQPHGTSGCQMQFIRGKEDTVGRGVGIGHFPPPLIAADPNGEGLRMLLRDAARGNVAGEGQPADDHHRGGHRTTDHEAGATFRSLPLRLWQLNHSKRRFPFDSW